MDQGTVAQRRARWPSSVSPPVTLCLICRGQVSFSAFSYSLALFSENTTAEEPSGRSPDADRIYPDHHGNKTVSWKGSGKVKYEGLSFSHTDSSRHVPFCHRSKAEDRGGPHRVVPASAGGRRERLPARVPFPRVFCGPEAREGVRAKSLRGSRADFAYFVSPTPEGPDSSSKVGRDSSWP